MSWRDVYNQPSFRGVPFHADSTDESGGRRLVTHEYPGRDIPFHEDLGGSAKPISVDGYVSGTNYHLERDALKRALDARGPGELVHPYHGVIQVRVRSYTLREDVTDGGVARFSMTFVVDGEARYPSARQNVRAGVESASETLRDDASSSLVSSFDALGVPEFVNQSAEAVLGTAVDNIESAFSGIIGDQEAGADYILRLARVRDNVQSLVTAPQDMADELRGLFDVAGTVAAGPRRASRANRRVYDDTGSTIQQGTTPARQQEAQNNNALRGYVRALALADAADNAAAVEYETFDDAATARNELLDRIDAETQLVDDDTVFLSLENLRAKVAAAVPDPDASLPRLVIYKPVIAEPSLLAAYRLYGDAGRGDEIVSRNMIKHPMFLPGGSELQVLSDA